jgi:hypothetical protein
MDPDPDPGGPKIYRSDGSGLRSGPATLLYWSMSHTRPWRDTVESCLTLVLVTHVKHRRVSDSAGCQGTLSHDSPLSLSPVWVVGYLGVCAKKEEINLMILWESCWWRTHWKRVTLSLLLLFFLLFCHWSFEAYVAKRASIICLLCYHNMSHVYHSLHFQTKMTWRFRPRHGRTCDECDQWSKEEVIRRESDHKRELKKRVKLKEKCEKVRHKKNNSRVRITKYTT